MTLEQIKTAVLAGKVVCCASGIYEVRHTDGQWLIVCVQNGSATGLTWTDGMTLNGNEDQFFIAE